MKYTKEDLMNTWGVVESKDHAEYIVELAELHGFGVWKSTKFVESSDISMFLFDARDDELQLYHYDISLSASIKFKQITILLPPKNKEWGVRTPPKHFDCVCAKCGGKCCTGFCGDLPKVGDKVLIDLSGSDAIYSHNIDGLEAEVMAIFKDVDTTVYFASCNGSCYCFTSDILKKPKSKQDLLIEELHQKLLANNCSDEYLLACDIVQGKIEGLSYE